jgi:hypothetical protein
VVRCLRMPDPARLLAWFAGILAEYEPGHDLSLSELAGRYGSLLGVQIAVERGAGMVFGLSLTAESAAVLGGAGLPALRGTLARLRGHIEHRHGVRGRAEIGRWDAALQRGPEAPAVLVDALHLPDGAPPAPWTRLGRIPVGGLLAAGFGLGGELVLVVSSTGRGVFDGRTGERLARVRETVDNTCYREEDGFAIGIGPLGGGRVAVDGLNHRCRVLARDTEDGWRLVLRLEGGHECALLAAPSADPLPRGPAIHVAALEEARAAGFSRTGRTLLLAEPHTLHLFNR